LIGGRTAPIDLEAAQDPATLHRDDGKAGTGTKPSAPPKKKPPKSDKELIAAAAASKKASDVKKIKGFTEATDTERIEFIKILLDQSLIGPYDKGALEKIWKSFGDRLAAVLKANLALYRKTKSRGAKVPDVDLAAARVHKTRAPVVGGVTYKGESRFDLVLKPDALEIRVKIAFKKATDKVKIPTAKWVSAIRKTWNRFDAVKKDGSEKFAINVVPQAVDSGGDVDVTVKKGEGRATRTTWFEEIDDRTAAHEFGHMIGFRDEYQISAADYKATVGVEPPKGVTEETGKPDEIAKKMRTALHPDADAEKDMTEGKKGDTRAAAARKVVRDFKLRQGEFARKVAAEYRKTYGVDIVKDIVDRIPAKHHWEIVDPFTFSTHTIMGQFYEATKAEHDHPVAPRHMADFVKYVKDTRGGEWEAKER
jgi:hypothetical protein